MLFTKTRPLRIGTDCSGIEAPIVALQQLKIPFQHVFSSEIDPSCISTIQSNFHPQILFHDMRQRSLKEIPDIDVYVCGFPCQPFSITGNRKGTMDPRGTIFWECVRVIVQKRPLFFILENVPGILSIQEGKLFHSMMDALQRIKGYYVDWKILNTKDYGIPQSRKRVFIIGFQIQYKQSEWKWPISIPCKSLHDYIDFSDNQRHSNITPRMQIIFDNVPEGSKFINLSFARDTNRNTHQFCPTITASGNMWCVPLMRYASVKELLRLQGFSTRMKFHKISNWKRKRQIGNSISVNVLKALFINLIHLF